MVSTRSSTPAHALVGRLDNVEQVLHGKRQTRQDLRAYCSNDKVSADSNSHISECHKDNESATEQTPVTNAAVVCDSDSELSEISEAALEHISQIPQHSTPHGISPSDQSDPIETIMTDKDMADDQLISYEVDVGSNKRIKVSENKWKVAAAAAVAAPLSPAPVTSYLQENTPAITNVQSSLLVTKSIHTTEQSTPQTDRVAVPKTSQRNLPPLLSPTLPPSLEAFVASKTSSRTQTFSPAVQSANTSLKMTIVPKAQLDTLKSHNSILRSHNLSLARQNTGLRHENAAAILLHQEVMDMEPLDHTSCVRKEDYQHVMDENDKLRNEVVQLRGDWQLMQECGFEWARREIGWNTERETLKRERLQTLGQLNESRTREVKLAARIDEAEKRANRAEYLVQQLGGALEQERQGAKHLQEQTEQLVAKFRAMKEGANLLEM